MHFLQTLSLKPLAALLAASGLLVVALPVHATVVVDGLTATALAQAGSQPLSSGGPDNTAPDVSATTYSNDSAGDAYSRAFGMTTGPYAVSSSGSGVYDAQALFTRTWNITNDTATAQQYSFSFYVYGGYIYANNPGASGSGWSSYLLDIALNGADLFTSGARINSDGSYTETGTRLTNVSSYVSTSSASYSWSGTTLTLDLGVLDPGESQLLSYDMVSHSFGDYGTVEVCGYGNVPQLMMAAVAVDDGYGGNGEYCYTTTGNSSSFAGDPSELSATPIFSPTITARAINDVPEPGSLALLGLGLTAAMALRPRRRPTR